MVPLQNYDVDRLRRPVGHEQVPPSRFQEVVPVKTSSRSPSTSSVRSRRRWEYRSGLAPGGLPWVHICIGGPTESGYRLGVARGVIALGDVAIGVVALGGVAVGLVGIGGVALGLAALAGIGVGLFALGGLAIGVTAYGAVAIGLTSHGALASGLALVRRLPRAGTCSHPTVEHIYS
jgi:hypothetical protein